MKTKNKLSVKFDDFWNDISLTKYQLERADEYLIDNIYSVAKRAGWIPKALRKGSLTKRPPLKNKLTEVEQDISSRIILEEKSFIPPQVINKDDACYFHPYMKKDEIPEDEEEYLDKLEKIVDCEVKVIEANEYMSDDGKRNEGKLVRYKLEQNDFRGKRVETEVTHEKLTTKIRFSTFLVSKGYVKIPLGKIKISTCSMSS